MTSKASNNYIKAGAFVEIKRSAHAAAIKAIEPVKSFYHTNATFESVNEAYTKGTYKGVSLIFHNESGYVRIDDLAEMAFRHDEELVKKKNYKPTHSKVQHFNTWIRRESVAEILDDKRRGNGVDKLIILNTDSNNKYRGTFLDRSVAIVYVNWLSPFFGIYVNDIIFGYQRYIIKTSFETELKKLEAQHAKRAEIYNELRSNVDEISAKDLIASRSDNKVESNTNSNNISGAIADATDAVLNDGDLANILDYINDKDLRYFVTTSHDGFINCVVTRNNTKTPSTARY